MKKQEIQEQLEKAKMLLHEKLKDNLTLKSERVKELRLEISIFEWILGD